MTEEVGVADSTQGIVARYRPEDPRRIREFRGRLVSLKWDPANVLASLNELFVAVTVVASPVRFNSIQPNDDHQKESSARRTGGARILRRHGHPALVGRRRPVTVRRLCADPSPWGPLIQQPLA